MDVTAHLDRLRALERALDVLPRWNRAVETGVLEGVEVHVVHALVRVLKTHGAAHGDDHDVGFEAAGSLIEDDWLLGDLDLRVLHFQRNNDVCDPQLLTDQE